ncbi:MAG TPA: hypothetical protein VGL77_15030, partial [Armatimonadota bacterium]
MRMLFLVFLTGLGLAGWADGFTTYGTRWFNRIAETDQVAVVRLEPGRVTQDMFIAIDRIPAGQTVTYILPFWQKPEGFTMTAQTSDGFRAEIIYPQYRQLRHEIRRANRMAVNRLIGDYLVSGLFSYAPLTPLGVLNYICPTFSKEGELLPAFKRVSIPAGSAELYHVSDTHDLQTLLAQAGLPARYAKVLQRYHTAYYAIMRLHGQKPGKAGATQGLHFHFTHRAKGDDYTYTYPLGTGGAWANPILLTEIYVTCPEGYYLSPTAPTLGQTVSYYEMERRIDDLGDTKATPAVPMLTASVTPPVRYLNAWHRAYTSSNPTEDITIHIAKRPRWTPLLAWRDADWMPVPFVLCGILGAFLLAVGLVIRPAWLKAGKPESLRKHALTLARVTFLPALIGIAFLAFIYLLPNPDKIAYNAVIMFILLLILLSSIFCAPVI